MLAIETHPDGPIMAVALSGELDAMAAPDLEARLDVLLASHAGDVALDFSELTYLNSTGVRTLIRLDQRLKAEGHALSVKGVSSRILRILRYSGLDAYFSIEPAQAVRIRSVSELTPESPYSITAR